MKSLAVLSKYTGCYDKWKDIRERYQLKWSSWDSLQTFSGVMTNTSDNFSSMVKWLKDALTQIPPSYGNILFFCTLTGLRAKEAVQSLSLLHSDPDSYLKDGTILEHFKYPDIFVRRTKKAYISIVNSRVLNVAKEAGDCSYNALRLAIKKRGLNMNMAYCRKIFATHLRMNGIEQETIDLLQGRTSKSVFVRYYFRPDFNHDRIKACVISLYNSIGMS